MKSIRNIFAIVAMLGCIVNGGHAQELAKIVNSSEALRLQAEMAEIRNMGASVSDESTRLKEEARRMRDQGDSNFSKSKKEILEKIDSLSKEGDSLRKVWFKLRVEYSREILKTEESQKVLREMLEAVSADDSDLAGKIKWDYRRSLLDAASEKVRFGKIDRETSREELKAIYKIIRALEVLAFPPVKRVDVLH